MKKVALLLSVVFFVPLLATAFLVASSSEANAAVDVVCFNDLFQRKIGEPRHETNTFPGVKGPATVKVYNGDGNGWLDRATVANVIINGKVIFRVNDFNKKVKYLQAQVNLLEGNNTVDVNLLGMPGVRIRVEVVQNINSNGPEATDLTMKVMSSALLRNSNNAVLSLVADANRDKIESKLKELNPESRTKLAESLNIAVPVFISERYSEYKSSIVFPNGIRYIGKLVLIKTESGWKFTDI